MGVSKDIHTLVAFYAEKYLPVPTGQDGRWASASGRLCDKDRLSVLETEFDYRLIQITSQPWQCKSTSSYSLVVKLHIIFSDFLSTILWCQENVSKQQNINPLKAENNLLKPTGHVMHQQFNIQQLYVLPTLYLGVLYLSENKQQLVPLTA